MNGPKFLYITHCHPLYKERNVVTCEIQQIMKTTVGFHLYISRLVIFIGVEWWLPDAEGGKC